jgi:hypothetical protein
MSNHKSYISSYAYTIPIFSGYHGLATSNSSGDNSEQKKEDADASRDESSEQAKKLSEANGGSTNPKVDTPLASTPPEENLFPKPRKASEANGGLNQKQAVPSPTKEDTPLNSDMASNDATQSVDTDGKKHSATLESLVEDVKNTVKMRAAATGQ